MGLTFWNLWRNYPTNQHPRDAQPCKNKYGRSAFDNQCALRLSIALERSGVSLASFPGKVCTHGHARAAEAMAKWLQVPPMSELLPAPVEFLGGIYKRHPGIVGRVGIMAFFDYWSRSTDRTGHPTGDHIDLWNGIDTGSRSPPHTFTDARKILFWELPKWHNVGCTDEAAP